MEFLPPGWMTAESCLAKHDQHQILAASVKSKFEGENDFKACNTEIKMQLWFQQFSICSNIAVSCSYFIHIRFTENKLLTFMVILL